MPGNARARSSLIRLPSCWRSATRNWRRVARRRHCKHSTKQQPACRRALPLRSAILLFANLAHGRTMAWGALGDSQRAISFAEETVTLRPERSEDWLELSRLYDREQRLDDARRARERAASINRGQASPTRPR